MNDLTRERLLESSQAMAALSGQPVSLDEVIATHVQLSAVLLEAVIEQANEIRILQSQIDQFVLGDSA